MLPLTRDRTTVTRSLVAELERRAEELAALDVQNARRLYVLYAGNSYSYASASIVYWPLLQASSIEAYLYPVEDPLYHMLAYRDEEAAIIVFYEEGAENYVVRTSHVASTLGYTAIHVTPLLPPIIEEQVVAHSNNKLIALDSKPLGLFSVLIAAKIAARILQGAQGVKVRVERVLAEYKEVSPVVEQLYSIYQQELAKIVEATRASLVVLYASPTLRGAASYLAEALNMAAGKLVALVKPLSSLPADISRGLVVKPVLVYTGAEEDLAREAEFRVVRTGGSIVAKLVIKTDPVTAPLYLSLLASML